MLREATDLSGVGRPEAQPDLVELHRPVGRDVLAAVPAVHPVEGERRLGPCTRKASRLGRRRARTIHHDVTEPFEARAIADIEQLVGLHGRIMAETGRQPRT